MTSATDQFGAITLKNMPGACPEIKGGGEGCGSGHFTKIKPSLLPLDLMQD